MNLSEIMTLNEAIEPLKAGKKVSRKLWNDNEYYQKRTDSYHGPYLPDYDDITTDDWEVVE